MEFRLLGPVGVRVAGREVDIGPARQRGAFAVLLLERGRPLATEALIARVWGAEPPAAAREVLYTYVSRLRAALRVAEGVALVRDARGYRLSAPADAVDLHRFDRLLSAARDGDDPPEQRLERAREALALWRGRPLDGLSGPWLDRVRDQLERQWLGALATRFELELRLGRHVEVIDELSALVARYPTAEPMAAHLMRALHRGGRRIEALAVYRDTRRALVEQHGLDPGPELRRLERQILADEPDGAPPAADPEPAAGPAAPPPDELPAAPAGFVGRAAELARLDRLAGEPPHVVAVTGPPGVGKTALALRWAHAARDRFPGGVLYVDLRGFGVEPPHDPALVLERLLRSLGVPAARIPADPDERAARYRSTLAGRRVLALLDNAASSDQVRPLLPGAGPSLVLVTSRQRLDGLAATHGAARMTLGPLPRDDAIVLIGQHAGPAARAVDVARLAALCDDLPLALRIAAARLAADPGGRLVADLSDEGGRLGQLAVEGGDVSVRAAVAVSLRPLSGPARALYRLLGLHPGPRPSAAACAALADLPLPAVRSALDELAAAHLVAPAGADRLVMHDLIRLHARELLRAEEGAAGRDAALGRLLRWYRDAANAADRILRPEERPNFESTVDPLGLTTPAQALEWLDAEADNLTAAVERARAADSRLCWQIAASMHGWLFRRGHRSRWIALYELAAQAARAAGDDDGEALVTGRLCIPYSLLGDAPKAVAACQRAYALRYGMGDLLGAATALLNLGAVRVNAEQPDAAIASLVEAEKLSRRLPGAAHLKALIHSNLGEAHQLAGRYAEALDEYRRALEIGEAGCGDRDVAQILYGLAGLHRQLGDPAEGIRYARRCVTRAERTGDTLLRAEAYEEIGWCHDRLGDRVDAESYLRRALAVYEAKGHRYAERVRARLRGGPPADSGEPGTRADARR